MVKKNRGSHKRPKLVDAYAEAVADDQPAATAAARKGSEGCGEVKGEGMSAAAAESSGGSSEDDRDEGQEEKDTSKKGGRRHKNPTAASYASKRSKCGSKTKRTPHAPASVPKYKFTARLKENHNEPIYSINFNFADLRYKDYFATIGSNRASIYRLHKNGGIVPVQVFVDEDATEKWYTCCWSTCLERGHPLLVVAGNNGIIKVLNVATNRVAQVRTHTSVVCLRAHERGCGLRCWSGTGPPCTSCTATRSILT
jgi:hypothetical protein